MTTAQLFEREKDLLEDIIDGKIAYDMAKSFLEQWMIGYTEENIKLDRKKVSDNVKLCLRIYDNINGGYSEKDLGQEVSTERENEYIGINYNSIHNTPIIELK